MESYIGTSKQIAFASASVILGAWAFKTVNEISGPAFEPIMGACMDTSVPIEEFAEKTGYHTYEPMVGFGVFNVLVCLITQFLLELRETYPAGILTWGGVIVVAFPFGVASTIEAGRAGATGLIRYPLILGLLYQLFGISVMAPLLWVPAYIYGRGNGGVSVTRSIMSVPMSIPGLLLTACVFTLDTSSYLWTLAAGTLGGPGLPMVAILLWGDTPPTKATPTTVSTAVWAYRATMIAAFLTYAVLVYIAYITYGTNVVALWEDVWTNAGPSVAFMTIDTLVLFAGVCLHLAFRSTTAAMKAVVLTPLLGPGAACCLAMAELEETTEKAKKVTHEKSS